MKILLCYSKDHFDPKVPPNKHESWGISANILAREFYGALSKMGDVTYSDGFDYQQHAGQSYDLFVGIERNFSKLLDVCEIKKSVLIAVNMHPRERNKILRHFARHELNDLSALAAGDLVDEKDITRSIKKADYILCVGNNATYNSYIKNGVPRTKIKTFNYGTLEKVSPIKRPQGRARILYSASRIGMRKGFDIVEKLMLDNQDADFHLDIVGLPSSDLYAQKIDALVKKLKGKATFHGYVPAKSSRYRQIYRSNDFLLFPSLEEGQAGTVVEAMFYGLVPLITAASGTDFAPFGFLEPKVNSSANDEIMSTVLSLGKNEVAIKKRKSQEYYLEFHESLSDSLHESLENCIAGHLYPKVSLVLAIYNKEKIIKNLVRLMDRAAREYRNVEAHIIFDGCTDNTERIVRRFYKRNKGYQVHYYATPNIFEVKSNNLGLRKSTGKYAAIVQDDNYIFDKYAIFEAVQFMDKDPRAAILGGLAGVNFFPLGTKNLSGSGQITMNEHEVYWRQDENTDPRLINRVFEVDACMRGPLFLRKEFLEKHGYLDEAYVPLYSDDMDICFRTRKYGYKVYCMLMNVANKSHTMAHYDSEKAQYFAKIMERNADIFYSRWKPTREKDYTWLNRISMWKPNRVVWKGIKNAAR